MANVHLLYGRPLAADDEPPPLRVTGSLPSFQPGAAYEGRLQIIDAIGDCKVEMVESDLPPGAYAYVDNVADEVVLKWPTWSPPHDLATEVPNGGFESGDDGHWYKPAGWAIEPSGAHTGTYAAVYRGRGTSSLSGTMVPVVPDTSITATAQIQQGASSAGNVVARIILIYYDLARRTQGGEGEGFFGGNLVRSGSHGAWHPSTVTAVAPPWAAYVGVDVSANRKRQNKPLWVDDITWNHVYSVGVNWLYDFTVTFKVTDSANRVAYWSGVIPYQSFFVTSQLYGLLQSELIGVGFGAAPGGFVLKVGSTDGSTHDAALVAFSLQGFALESKAAEDPFDAFAVTYSLHSFVLRDARVQIAADDNTVVAFTIQAFVLKQQPLGAASDDANITFTLQGFTFE